MKDCLKVSTIIEPVTLWCFGCSFALSFNLSAVVYFACVRNILTEACGPKAEFLISLSPCIFNYIFVKSRHLKFGNVAEGYLVINNRSFL